MKKSLDAKRVKSPMGIKKVRSKSHCKWIRKEQRLTICCKVTFFFKKEKTRKSFSIRRVLNWFKRSRFTANLLRKVLSRLFGL